MMGRLVVVIITGQAFSPLEIKRRKYPSHYRLNINNLVTPQIEFLCKSM